MEQKKVKKIVDAGGEGPFYRFDPLIGYWGRPNMERDVSFWQGCETYIRCRLNEDGLRDKPFRMDKGEKSIVCVGGSHTWGGGVDQDKRYPDRLAEKTGRYTVNLGHCSFGLDQACLAIMKKAANYSPGVIIVEQYPWAVHRVLQKYVIGYLRPYFYLDAEGNIQLKKIPKLARFGWIRKIIGAYYNYCKELQEFKAGINLKNAYDARKDPMFILWKSNYYDYLYALVDQILIVIRDFCRQKGYELMFALGAVAQKFGEPSRTALIDYDLPSKRLQALLEKNRIAFADMTEPMLAVHSREDPVIFPDGHINAKGHDVFASVLRDRLNELGWLDR